MEADTRLFGKIDIAEDKILTLAGGIIGFPQLTHFTLIYDKEKGDDRNTILWLQSMDEPKFALPVIVPNVIIPDYNPVVNDELLAPLDPLTDENTYVLVTVKVPKDIKQMTVNLKAPIIINTDTRVGAQLIVENEDYEVRYPVYDLLKNGKEDA